MANNPPSLPGVPNQNVQNDSALNAAMGMASTSATSEKHQTEANPKVVDFLLKTLVNWGRLRHGGNQWAGWAAFLSFFRHVVKLDLPQYEQWQHYETAAIYGGPRFMHAEFWMVSDFPRVISLDPQNRSHSGEGPALAWKDGFEIFSWHGTNIPSRWITEPGYLTAEMALQQENLELRQCACDILGWEKILSSIPNRVIATDENPMIGTLFAVDLPDAPDERYVRALCATGRTIVYRTTKAVKTPLEACAESYGITPETYLPEVRT